MATYDPTIAFGLAKFSRNAYENEAKIRNDLGGSEFFQFFHGIDVTSDTQAFIVKLRGHVIVAFRGTQQWQDAVTDALAVKKWVNIFPPRRIHTGFSLAYDTVRHDILNAIKTLSPPRVFVTGHSLGGALATLAALDLATEHPSTQITMYNFGSPRVGDWGYAGFYNGNVSESFRVVVPADIVPKVPLGGWRPFGYRHVRREHELRNITLPHLLHELDESYIPQLKEGSAGVSFFEGSP